MNALTPWIQALGWTLVHFLWQGVLVGVAFAAARALLPKANCRARYATGLAALAALTLWPLATLIALRPQFDADVSAIELGVANVAQAGPAQASGLLAGLDQALPWLVLLWGAGVLAMAARTLHQWHELSQVARRWAHAQPELDALMQALTRRFGFVRRVRVLVSSRIDTPMLFGWIKPVVLLPAAVALGFPRHQIELILAHELGHLRRYDHLVNLAQALLETLLFYHPVVHWISREVRNERELCCDELVLQLTSGEPREYARTLASLEELRHVAGSLALAANGGELLERVRRIVGMPAPRLSVERRASGRWLLVAFALGTALLVVQRIERATDHAFTAPRLAISWLGALDSARLMPSVAPMDSFHLPRLRLAPVTIPAAPAAAQVAASTAKEKTAPEAVVSARSAFASPPAPVPLPTMAAPPATTTAATAQQPTELASIPVAQQAPAESSPVRQRKPVATHTVAPTFPGFAHTESSRVEASFTIADDGSVRDIRFAQGGDGAFERAAEKALRQWRFDPDTVPADEGIRYTQVFVFAKSRASGERCILATGSRICRDIGEGTLAKVYNND
jgi:TonB family protein